MISRLLSRFRKKTIPQPFQLEQISSRTINSPLLSFSNNVVSQDGEDGIIEAIFSIIQAKHKYCVEFGAWDGKYFSNTWNLLTNKQWHGLLIEGNSQKFEELQQNFSENPHVMCINRFVEYVDGANSLDTIFKEMDVPYDLDFISIDVDGTDYFVWESLKMFRPQVIVVEFNPSIPNDVVFIQAKSSEINQGCSLHALILLGKRKGYELVCCTGWNAFFVEKELFPLFDIKNNHIDIMYQPICDGRIFHGYDSTIYIAGMPRLIWSQQSVDSADFQVLPITKRIFGDAQH